MFCKEVEMKIKFEYEGQKRAILLPQPVKYQQLINKLHELCDSPSFLIEFSAAEGQYIREIECQEDLDDIVNLTKSNVNASCLLLKLVPCSSVAQHSVSRPSEAYNESGFFKDEPFPVSGFNTSAGSSQPLSASLPFRNRRTIKAMELLKKKVDYIPETEDHPSVFIPEFSDFKASPSRDYSEKKPSDRQTLQGSVESSLPCGSPSAVRLDQSQSSFFQLQPDDLYHNNQKFSTSSLVRHNFETKVLPRSQLNDAVPERGHPSTKVEHQPSDTVQSTFLAQQSYESHKKTSSFSPGRWVKGKLLGRGAFGQVFTGYDVDRGIEFAVKQVQIYSQSCEVLQQIEALEMEIYVLQGTQHKHIVEFYGMLREPDCLSIFMEFVPMGSLKDHINRYGPLTERVTALYSSQILKGLAYLHKKMIVHRDVKGANILRDHHGNLKLGDFGAAKILESQSIAESSKIAGTPYFMAPEIIRGEVCGCCSDIWSVGCTVVEMLTKNPPWYQYDSIAAIYKIGSTWPPEYNLPENASNKVKCFLELCFAEDAKRRPKAEELLLQSFVYQAH